MKLRYLAVALLALSLSGCGSRVRTVSTIYHGDDHLERGTIAVIPANKDFTSSLEFRTVGNYLLDKLAQNGYVAVAADQRPDFVAVLNYETSKPRYVTEKGRRIIHTVTDSITGDKTSTVKEPTTHLAIFTHTMRIDIFKSSIDNKPGKKYEISASNQGLCGNMNPLIFTGMIDAVFVDFPRNNGQTNESTVQVSKKMEKC
ncbi:MAG: hypothetical protein QM537_06255 [Candidatus Symbiobacter sp.]|nr:hypothetical protein [Candidatus Symbiobacter sp.]